MCISEKFLGAAGLDHIWRATRKWGQATLRNVYSWEGDEMLAQVKELQIKWREPNFTHILA